MSTSISAKNTRIGTVIGMHILMLFALIFQMVFRPPADVRFDIEVELASTVTYLTDADYSDIRYKTNQRYQSWVHDSGIYPVIEIMLTPQAHYPDNSPRKLFAGVFSESWLYQLLENFQLFSYQMVHRVTLMQFWFIALLPMCTAIVATGFYHWRIKQYQLGGSSVNHVRGYMKLMWLMLFVLGLYLITPNLFGPYTIYAPAALLVIIATTISLVFSNYSK